MVGNSCVGNAFEQPLFMGFLCLMSKVSNQNIDNKDSDCFLALPGEIPKVATARDRNTSLINYVCLSTRTRTHTERVIQQIHGWLHCPEDKEQLCHAVIRVGRGGEGEQQSVLVEGWLEGIVWLNREMLLSHVSHPFQHKQKGCLSPSALFSVIVIL